MSKILRVLKTNAKAAKTIMVVGSMIDDMLISRELPIPPKQLPASRPASAMKNRARASKYKKRMMFPIPPMGSGIKTSGTKRAATRIAASVARGVTRVIREELGE
jgi:hypothetical protein